MKSRTGAATEAVDRPRLISRSIAELSAIANEYDFDPALRLRYWIRSASTLERQARIYDDEKVYDEAYILYMRYAQLVLNSLHTHPEARRIPEKVLLVKLTKSLPRVLERLQELKPLIEEAHGMYVERQQAIESRRQELEAERRRHSEQGDEEEYARQEVSYDMSGLGVSEHPEILGNKAEVEVDVRRGPEEEYPKIPSLYGEIGLGQQQQQQQQQTSLAHQQEQQPPSSSIEHKPAAQTEGGAPLRTVFVPEELRSKFLELALPNTRKKLETCGILCGVLNRNAFFVTHLLVPKQEATTDTCATTDEEGMFGFLDEHELFTLGWIHTHPTQTCFLSSVDLHTQNSYQLMLSEAIAIVCAPMHEPSWGVFRLTDPPGIRAITSCRRPGTFHPHEERDIYTTCRMPAGHVSVRSGLPFSVVDMR